MNKILTNVFLVTIGAAIGSVVTWKLVKTRYEKIAQEEIDSVKEEYSKMSKDLKKQIDIWRTNINAHKDNGCADDAEDDEYYPDEYNRDPIEHERKMVEYHKLVSKYRNDDTENGKEGDEREEEPEEDLCVRGPYVISPDEFNNSPGYSLQPLDYYSDGILADGWGVEVDIDDTIGEESLNHFDEYIDDVLYVRNEEKEIDYEVTRDPRTYEEAVKVTLKTQM